MANRIPRVPVREQDPKVRATNFEEVCYGYNKEEALLEASRCLNCRNPRCMTACPVGLQIPRFIAELAAGNVAGAAAVIAEDSSLPAVCGRVCPQETQCEGSCILGVKGEPVAIGKLERFVADYTRMGDAAGSEMGAGQAVPSGNRATLGSVRGGTASEMGGPRKSQICGVQQAQRWGPQDGLQPELPGGSEGAAVRKNAPHSPYVESYRRATRRVETFRFNPNTVSVEDLMRLGFSEKQARAIDNYRAKGGRFRRKADFAKSFVVADSVFRRLEPYIDIPRLDLNRADSAALDALPGIGPYYAARIISYRDELGGYSYPEQLMDIYRFDREKYDALSDLVFCSRPAPYALWSLPADSLRLHPYIRSWQTARAIVLFRDHTPREDWSVDALAAAGILLPDDASRLARCVLAPP